MPDTTNPQKQMPELRFSRADHVEPKSIQNFKANRAKALAENDQIDDMALLHSLIQSLSQDTLKAIRDHNSEQDRKRLDKVIQAMYAPL